MKEFLEYLVKNIVHHQDQVVVEEQKSEGEPAPGSESTSSTTHLTLVLKVADEDMGLVIGKKGQTISALRRLLRLRNLNSGEYASLNLELVEAERATANDQPDNTGDNESTPAEADE
jgi:predicted RNA-binding protein YlqC (UPF0109 family)